jgi:MarR family transcriptional regulator, organic hydroperoxide resistance regulator
LFSVTRPTPLDDALRLVIGRMHGVWHQRMRELDLTPPQSITMKLLLDGPQPMGIVAEYLMCDASTLTGIADRMEERGFIERRSDHADRRIKLLALTDHGREVVRSIDQPLTKVLPGLERLTDAERSTLTDLLQRAFS